MNGEGWTASGILIYGVSDVQVNNNVVEKGQLGIGVLGDNNKVVNNYLEKGTWSIAVYSGFNNKVIHNTIIGYESGVSDYGNERKVARQRTGSPINNNNKHSLYFFFFTESVTIIPKSKIFFTT